VPLERLRRFGDGRGVGEARYARGSTMIIGRGRHGTDVAVGTGGAV